MKRSYCLIRNALITVVFALTLLPASAVAYDFTFTSPVNESTHYVGDVVRISFIPNSDTAQVGRAQIQFSADNGKGWWTLLTLNGTDTVSVNLHLDYKIPLYVRSSLDSVLTISTVAKFRIKVYNSSTILAESDKFTIRDSTSAVLQNYSKSIQINSNLYQSTILQLNSRSGNRFSHKNELVNIFSVSGRIQSQSVQNSNGARAVGQYLVVPRNGLSK